MVSLRSTYPHLAQAGRMYVDGNWVRPSTGTTFVVVNPATEEPLYSVAEAGVADVASAVTAARTAFDSGAWTGLSPVERAGYLRAMAERLAARNDELAQIWTNQTGLTYARSRAIIPVMVDTFRYYADLADSYPFLERHDAATAAPVGVLVREPVGVVAAIVAWNGPALLIASKTVPALLAGCTVVIKASPEGPGEALLFAEVADEVGLPPGVVNVVVADRAASESLVRDPRVDKISFTGSTAAGQQVAALCGARTARVSLELGGKSPAVVLEDCDLEATADSLSDAITFLAGQVCSAVTRVVATPQTYGELTELLSSRFEAVRVGDPYDPETQMGPLATVRQRRRVEDYIALGRSSGARLVAGGTAPADLDRGYYLRPTLFADVDNAAVIAQEEIFGPVVCVIPARDEAHALAIANDSQFGLSSAVFTRDPERAWHVARQLRCGMVAHNAVRNELGIAFGGFKQSGIGRKGGLEGMLPFLESKTVTLDAAPFGLGWA